MDQRQDPEWESMRQMLVERLEHDEKLQRTDTFISRVSWPTIAIVAALFVVGASYSYIHVGSIFSFLSR